MKPYEDGGMYGIAFAWKQYSEIFYPPPIPRWFVNRGQAEGYLKHIVLEEGMRAFLIKEVIDDE